MSQSPENRKTYYDILGVEGNATPLELESAFRKLAKQCHPDICEDAQDGASFKLLFQAYAVLSDPEKRRHYDQSQSGRRRPRRSSPPGTHFRPHGVSLPGGSIHGTEPADIRDLLQVFIDSMLFPHRLPAGTQKYLHPELNVESELPVTPEEARRGTVVELKMQYENDDPPRFVSLDVPAGVRNDSVLLLRNWGKRSLDGMATGDLILRIRVLPSW